MNSMMDFRYALRQFARSPGFAAVAVLTLAVGIGAGVALFSVVHGVLLKPLPYPQPDRIVRLFHLNDAGHAARPSDPDFADLRDRSMSFESMTQFGTGVSSVAGGSQPSRTMHARADAGFFDVIGVSPVLGRRFSVDETARGGPPAVIVSHRYWQRHLNGDPAILGRTLRIDDVEHPVVGVMPEGFDYPAGADLWTPLVPTGTSRTAHNSEAAARLARGVTVEQAEAELTAIAQSIRAMHGDDATIAGVRVLPLHDQLTSGVGPLLWSLLGAAALLFAIAWTNVASLVLARATARERELGVRVALGAGAARLVRQFIAEAALLTAAGGAIGIALAAVAVRAFVAAPPRGIARVDAIGIDATVAAFALTVSVVAALGLGLFGAWRATRTGAAAATRQREAGGRTGRRAASSLVAVQVALALVLVIGAGLLGRSFMQVLAVDPGFRIDDAVAMRIALPSPRAPAEVERQRAFHARLLDELRALPGVEQAGAINLLPVADGRWNGTFVQLTRPDEVTGFEAWIALARTPGRHGNADYRFVSDGYFDAMGIPVLAGRAVETRDAAGAPHVVVVNETFAREHYPDRDPIGQLVHFGNMDGVMEPKRVVGVVGDVRESGLERETEPTMFAALQQRRAAGQFSFVMRTSGDPLSVIPAARAALASMDPALPAEFMTLDEVMSASLGQRRFVLSLVAAFGAAALALALVGLYGAMTFSVNQRTREIGVRMAVGAPRDRVVAMVVGEGLRVVLIGGAVGVAGALLLGRVAEAFMFGVSRFDPVTFVAAPVLLVAAAALTAWLPARRAARIDPNVTLRAE